MTGFSPRRQSLSVYILDGFAGQASLMKKLGKYKSGKACLSVKTLSVGGEFVTYVNITTGVSGPNVTHSKKLGVSWSIDAGVEAKVEDQTTHASIL